MSEFIPKILPLLLASCLLLTAAAADDVLTTKPATKQRPLITVGKDTTVLTEPLDEEGYVDYITHLNAEMSKGVTAENNAALLLAEICRPAEIKHELLKDYYRLLGIMVPPKEEGFFRDYDEFAEDGKVGELVDQLDLALARPWTKDEFPALARWIHHNEKPLAVAIRASNRSKLYAPLVGGPPLINVVLPQLNESHAVARALTARAMLRAGEGDIDAARRDLTAVHRLAALLDQGVTTIDAIVAIAVDRTALEAEIGLAHSDKLAVEQTRELQAQIAKLKPMKSSNDRIDKMERFTFIDGVTFLARHPKQTDEFDVFGNLAKLIEETIDWNVALRYGNGCFDRLVAALNQPTVRLQKAALEDIRDELRDIADTCRSGKRLAEVARETGKAREKLVGTAIGEEMVLFSLPVLDAVHDAELRHRVQRELVAASFALSAYRQEHRKYPDDLSTLIPDYLTAPPQDFYSGQPAIYKSDGEAYLLYSIGSNLKDDGGFGLKDEDAPEDADDIAIRTRSILRK